jgi:hypothetical protein
MHFTACVIKFSPEIRHEPFIRDRKTVVSPERVCEKIRCLQEP